MAESEVQDEKKLHEEQLNEHKSDEHKSDVRNPNYVIQVGIAIPELGLPTVEFYMEPFHSFDEAKKRIEQFFVDRVLEEDELSEGELSLTYKGFVKSCCNMEGYIRLIHGQSERAMCGLFLAEILCLSSGKKTEVHAEDLYNNFKSKKPHLFEKVKKTKNKKRKKEQQQQEQE